jgi:hypothetical protein
MAKENEVTPSCGCIFCDLRLPIVLKDNKPHHEATDAERNTVLVECSYKRG